MTIAIISHLLNIPARQDFAIAGEITLGGKLLGIDQIKEKILAAQREKIRNVLLPKANEKEYNKLPDYLKKDITVYFAEDLLEVFSIEFPSVHFE